jgi:hypothetical protein
VPKCSRIDPLDYYQGNKDRAQPAFMRAGKFKNGELRLYAVGMNGRYLAAAFCGVAKHDSRSGTGVG